jgi:valyl-tRNA synthetase
MDNLNDWCISRQLWWGHQIPVFYCDNCDNEFVSENDIIDIKKCPKCNNVDIRQDNDVLDTWFSSALWPFSTLGWENGKYMSDTYNKDDLKEFYPNSLLITGFDILFFWVARMMMMGEHFMNKLPFKDVYLHALVKDEFGAKMSKSKGNVINPLDVIDEFSADVVRFSLCYLCVQGRDIKLGKKHLEVYRNFTNKLHNACNYLLIHQNSFKDLDEIEVKTPLGLYMLHKLNNSTIQIRTCLDSYKFNEAASEIYSIVWLEFCDNAIEFSKVSPQSINELGSIFKQILKLCSPFMPFISDNLYTRLSKDCKTYGKNNQTNSLIISAYPVAYKNIDKTKGSKYLEIFETIKKAISSIRRLKVNANKANAKIDLAYIKFNDKTFDFEMAKSFIQKLAKVNKLVLFDEKEQKKNEDNNQKLISDISDNLQSFLIQDENDTKESKAKLQIKTNKLQKEFDKLNTLLKNANFVKNAPKQVLEKNQIAVKNLSDNISKINEQIKKL